MRLFGPQSTQCQLCQGECPATDGHLCKQWLAANAVRYSPNAWRFAEYAPNHFALYSHDLNVALLTQDFGALLPVYRARPPWIAPVRKIAPKQVGIDLSKLEIKL